MCKIRSLFENVTLDLSRLVNQLQQAQPALAIVSRIPPVYKGNEHEVIRQIIPEFSTDMAAMQLASEAYNDLHIKSPFSQKSARRYVGVIHLRPAQQHCAEIVQLVHRINANKAEIEALVINENTTRQARFSAVHDNCPGVMTVHLYRKIHCFEEAMVKSVRFSWQRKDALHQPDKTTLMAQINTELERGSPDNSLPLIQLLRKVSSTPEAALRIRRPVKVQPAANIVTSTGLKTVTAPLPIIVVQNEDITSEQIAVFSAAQARKQRSDKRNNTVLGTFSGRTIEQVISDHQGSK
ncbi:MAG: DNA replication terminus site-binding protein [Moritella dasanensis]|jgi:DNA replication terminus site-binding protein